MSAAEAAAVSPSEARTLFAELEDLGTVILAVSGGPDSTALLFLAARWRNARKSGPKLVAVTIDHGLRPGSAREAAGVKRLAGRLHVAHRVLRWVGEKPRTGIQKTARAHRYRLLVSAARREGACHILTAHTLDDQAETVLLRLMRGSGLSGLAGMARSTPLDGMTLVRPLLQLEKTRLVATLKAAGLAFIEDPSNQDPRFARTWLRQLMPLLARRGLDAGRLAAFARRAERAERALGWATEVAFERLCLEASARQHVLDRRGVAELPTEIAVRLLGRTIGQMGHEGPVKLGKLETLVATVLGSGGARNGRVRRTLAGALITADPDRIVIEPAPRRSKQRKQGSSRVSR